MRYHHMCVIASDMDESLKFYRDLLGFEVIHDERYNDIGETGDANAGYKGAQVRLGLLRGPEGNLLELNQYFIPEVKKLSREQLGFGYTGIKKFSLEVDNIDEWLKKVEAAGYEIASDGITVFKTPSASYQTFIFNDPDGTMIQLMEKK